MTEPTRFVPWKKSAEWLAAAAPPSATVTALGVTDSDTYSAPASRSLARSNAFLDRKAVMTRSPTENPPEAGVFGVAGGLVTALGQP